ncbi:DUF2922 domain-containing protein [Chungangia koreensis]|uniref:DUF2922 domain-containing protein n=1 Tax=Chungangia koreensis TaxID=752657 RepID=A0ABV8X9B6_9LACT
MAQSLELRFETEAGKALTLTVDQPRVDLTEGEVESGMAAIIASDVFYVESLPLSVAKSARLVERNITNLYEA